MTGNAPPFEYCFLNKKNTFQGLDNVMKKKRYITRTVKVGCLLLALLFSLSFLQTYALRRLDHNSIRLNGFYHEQEQSLDVALLGASEVYTSFSSCRAYHEYGFTSYPYATESITASGILTALKEVVRTQKPKLILIEPNPFLYGNDKNESNEAHIRKLVDNIPINQNKIDFINQYIKPEDRIEYYLPLMKYHGIWSDYPEPGRRVVSTILQDMRGFSYLKGFRTTTGVFKPKQKVLNKKIIADNRESKLNANLEKKLIELLDYCKEQKLNVVFFRVPHLVYSQTATRVKRSNYAAEIINRYGYDYINMERDWKLVGIDPAKDFYNFDHVNIYGTVKVTDYLGGIIQNVYGVGKSELSAKQKEQWDASAEAFENLTRYCDDLIRNQHKVMRLEEDINTLNDIKKYA